MRLSLETKAIYLFIRAHIALHNISPTFRDIQEGCQMTTTSTIHRHLNILQANGDITWTKGQMRSIRLTKPMSR